MKTKIQRVRIKPLATAEMTKLDREMSELAALSTKQIRALARPLTAAEKAQWRRVRRGRPPKPLARKAARVLFTIDPQLLKQADQYARAHGLTRAQLIANGLQSVMSA